MGTELVRLQVPGRPVELLNLESGDAVEHVHTAYIKAGARAILTNTFGANPLRLAAFGLEQKAREINEAAVRIAMKARREAELPAVAVIASMGPTGRLLKPVGDARFDEVYESYRMQAHILAEAGVDGVLVETMSDLAEAKAAVLACKDEGLLVAATMTFEGDRTPMGVSPECAAITLQSLGALAVGANCSSGPHELVPVLKRMHRVSSVPLIARPNAGVPGKNELADVQSWCDGALSLLEAGVCVIGGCCGTTPAHISALRAAMRGFVVRPGALPPETAMLICGFNRYVWIEPGGYPCLVGERINPARKRALREDILSGKMEVVRLEARQQVASGAEALDLSADIPGQNVTKLIGRVVEAVQTVWDGPCFLDSACAGHLESIAAEFRGRPVLNSLRFVEPAFSEGLRMAKRLGACAVLLLSGTEGTPHTVEGRIRMAEDMLLKAETMGLHRSDLLIDPAVLPAAIESGSTFLESVELLAKRGFLTCGGVSNVSTGLPKRPALNAALISTSVCRGLNAVIADPCDEAARDAIAAGALLGGRDPGAKKYTERLGSRAPEAAGAPSEEAPSIQRVKRAVLSGDVSGALESVGVALQEGLKPEEILNEGITSAMAEAGRLFEEKKFFIPNLLLAAEAAKACLEVLRPKLGKATRGRGTVAMATVEGDIHDVGKNIVCAVLESRGFRVVDLGKSVPVEKVLEVLPSVDLVGLSSLMTTTLPAMERTLKAIKARCPSMKVIVGGGVLTAEYAASIGADGYAENAAGAAELVCSLFRRST